MSRGGEVEVHETPLLSGSAHGFCLLNLKESEEQKEMLEAKDDEDKESEVDGEVEERVTQRVQCDVQRIKRGRPHETLQTNKQKGHSRFFSCCSRECAHAPGLRPR